MELIIIMQTELVLSNNPIGLAHYHNGFVEIFLGSTKKVIDRKIFDTYEEIIEELVIHELLHEITKNQKEKIIDYWHILLCKLDNVNIKQSKDCSCPIDCFWRFVYESNKQKEG